jgi:hypothetical protein
MIALEDLFRTDRTDGPPSTSCSTRCKVCGMFSLGGLTWLRSHTCPDPFPPEVAQSMLDTLTVPGSVWHPMMVARATMSWRHGYCQTFDERRAGTPPVHHPPGRDLAL